MSVACSPCYSRKLYRWHTSALPVFKITQSRKLPIIQGSQIAPQNDVKPCRKMPHRWPSALELYCRRIPLMSIFHGWHCSAEAMVVPYKGRQVLIIHACKAFTLHTDCLFLRHTFKDGDRPRSRLSLPERHAEATTFRIANNIECKKNNKGLSSHG